MISLLERWERYGMAADGFKAGVVGVSDDEIRRAIAIAQAVEKMTHVEQKKAILDYADELLRGDK